ncbi:neutral zinc metallopeptidase [Nonomuraea longicatena]|uniref:Metalloprotease n=1 Tax=Nonomuraea longicatena TaxID=83682 RepID=A0ABN1PDE1_9ACTN
MKRPLAVIAALALAAGCGVAAPSATPASDDFEEDVETARVLTEGFWARRLGGSYRPVTDFVAYSGDNGPACGGGVAAPDNAFYCPDGHFIAYDETWLRSLWKELGDGSVYVIVLHEFGHAVQAQLQTSFEFNIQQELQADCYAGGTLSALVAGGELRADPGDEEELLTNLAAAGDPEEDWFDPAAHGTAEQRQRSFLTGYRSGVEGCR